MPKRSKHKHHKSHAMTLYRSAPKPVIIKQTKVVHKKSKHRRHHGGGGFSVGGLFSKERMGMMAGALAVGFLEKQGFVQNLPKLPIVGTLGTIGLGAYLLSNGGRNRIANEVATAALVLAAHELGQTGSIVGGGEEVADVGYVAGY